MSNEIANINRVNFAKCIEVFLMQGYQLSIFRDEYLNKWNLTVFTPPESPHEIVREFEDDNINNLLKSAVFEVLGLVI